MPSTGPYMPVRGLKEILIARSRRYVTIRDALDFVNSNLTAAEDKGATGTTPIEGQTPPGMDREESRQR